MKSLHSPFEKSPTWSRSEWSSRKKLELRLVAYAMPNLPNLAQLFAMFYDTWLRIAKYEPNITDFDFISPILAQESDCWNAGYYT